MLFAAAGSKPSLISKRPCCATMMNLSFRRNFGRSEGFRRREHFIRPASGGPALNVRSHSVILAPREAALPLQHPGSGQVGRGVEYDRVDLDRGQQHFAAGEVGHRLGLPRRGSRSLPAARRQTPASRLRGRIEVGAKSIDLLGLEHDVVAKEADVALYFPLPVSGCSSSFLRRIVDGDGARLAMPNISAQCLRLEVGHPEVRAHRIRRGPRD